MKCSNCGFIHKTKYQQYSDDVLLLLKSSYDFSSSLSEWKIATHIAHDIGIKNPNVKDARVVANCFKQIYGKKNGYFRVSNGKRLIKIPPLIVKQYDTRSF